MNPTVSSSDRELIDLLRHSGAQTVGQLVSQVGVTATAIRHRLNRLMAGGLVTRTHHVQGRGRPSHRYQLTSAGRQLTGNNLDDLAVVLWEEIRHLPDPEIRRKVISGVVERLANKYGHQVHGDTVQDRLQSFTRIFAERDIPVALAEENGLPVIKVSGCPYPTLAEDNRDICEMEQQLLAQLIGQPVELCECQQDGALCCSFQANE